VVDCGAAPGGWTQVAVERINSLGEKKDLPVGRIVAVDKAFMMPIEGAYVLELSDFTKPETRKKIHDYFSSDSSKADNGLVDTVLSDMAPSHCGATSVDHERAVELCYEALLFAVQNLAKNGHFLTKLWAGYLQQKLAKDMEKHFDSVSTVKPDASRDDSAEIFLLGRIFKGLKRSQ